MGGGAEGRTRSRTEFIKRQDLRGTIWFEAFPGVMGAYFINEGSINSETFIEIPAAFLENNGTVSGTVSGNTTSNTCRCPAKCPDNDQQLFGK